MATLSAPNLISRHHVWFVRFRVPQDVREAFDGKVYLSKTTGETDMARAAIKSRPILKEWKARVEAARNGTKTPMQAKVAALAAEYRSRMAADPDLAYDFLTEDVIHFLIGRLGISYDQFWTTMRDEAGNDYAVALEQFPGGQEASETLQVIASIKTPFLAHLDAWKPVSGLKDRQLDQYVRDLETFGTGRFVEALTQTDVQAWAEKQVTEEGITPKTVRRKLSALRNYWAYLQAHGIAPKTGDHARPFSDLRIPEKATKPGAEKRQPWTASEAVLLWKAAQARKDPPACRPDSAGSLHGGPN